MPQSLTLEWATTAKTFGHHDAAISALLANATERLPRCWSCSIEAIQRTDPVIAAAKKDGRFQPNKHDHSIVPLPSPASST